MSRRPRTWEFYAATARRRRTIWAWPRRPWGLSLRCSSDSSSTKRSFVTAAGKNSENRGTLMIGRTVGIIGVGRIGQNVAKRLGGWGMKILGFDPYVKQEAVDHLGITMVSLDQLLKESDAVTLHVVLTRETRGMIGMRELKLMKPTAFIVNTSRGPAIKETDLVQALNEKIIAGAALDVFEEEPMPADNRLRQVDPFKLILTPHNIGANPGSGRRVEKWRRKACWRSSTARYRIRW